MKDNFFKRLLSFIAALVLLVSVPIAANATVDEAQSFVDGILAYNYKKGGVDGTQDFINTVLAENAGVSSEWYVIALSQSGKKYDFSQYEQALYDYVNTNETGSASTRLKYCLALLAIGGDDSYIRQQLDASIGKQGIMSLVYGLHLLNNGCSSELHTVDSLISDILSLQLADGGWALSGSNSDVDVTAMTIQALSAYYAQRDDVANAVGRAVDLLSSLQKEDGEFASYGLKNPESAAQVLVALCSIGVDSKEDARFIKNGSNIFDVLSRYRTEEGGYCHISGGKANANATVQVFYSVISYLRMQNGETPFYIFDDNGEQNSDNSKVDSILSDIKEVSSESDDSSTSGDNQTHNYKLYILCALAFLALLAIVSLVVKKKSNLKNILLTVSVFAVLSFAVCFIDISSVDAYYGDSSSKTDIIGEVTVSIMCDKITDSGFENGIILKETRVTVSQGDTVYDILAEVTARNKIHLETNGSRDSVYVEGIGNVYELQHGDLSGWVYLVNGERPSVSAGDYILKDGDSIEWIYTLSLGEDIE